MALAEQIMEDVKNAMRAKEKEKLVTLRSLQAEFKKLAIDSGKEITDGDILQIITKGIKVRLDAASQFRGADRLDLAENEEREIAIYRAYQPEQLTTEALEAIVTEAIGELGAAGTPAMMGKVIGAVMGRVQGRADGGAVQAAVKKLLAS